ncbi:LPP20 family lipoprotein [Marinobacterium sp. YM272]|uniref:LPP20 family lipoprotein n=1 Tax=Marinobacterium sp. YM272 TaxID=3421654 RepID=UPI003D7FF654
MNKLKCALALAALVMLAGCETLARGFSDTVDAMPDADSTPRIEQTAEPHWVRATGYAPISLQPGETHQQKVLMAMRASKLRAYQELAGVIHGQYLYGTTQVDDLVISNDRFKTAVAGIVRGARVVKSYPVQDDTYATVLEVDLSQVQRAWIRAAD